MFLERHKALRKDSQDTPELYWRDNVQRTVYDQFGTRATVEAVQESTTPRSTKHTDQNNKDANDPQRLALQDILNRSEIDFSGAGYTQFAYRLGDVFDLFYLEQYQISFDQLVHMYERLFPGTLAHRYLLRVESRAWGHRNLTSLLEVLQDYETELAISQKNPDGLRPGAQDLVVHLRLGDVLTSPDCCITSKVSIRDLWESPTGFVNLDGNVKHNYNLQEYETLFNRLPNCTEIRNCVVVGAAHFLTDQNLHFRNVEYQRLVEGLLRSRFGCEIIRYEKDHPDETLVYLAAAQWLVAGMGGYAQIAAACVRARGGWVAYDRFNGEIASPHGAEPSLDDRQRSTYANSYIDWSRFPQYHETEQEHGNRSRC